MRITALVTALVADIALWIAMLSCLTASTFTEDPQKATHYLLVSILCAILIRQREDHA